MDTLELVIVHKKRDIELYDYISAELEKFNAGEAEGLDDKRIKLFRVNEKNWDNLLSAGKTGMFNDKIIFIGDFDGVEPVEAAFDRFGVRFGYNDSHMIISIDVDYDWDRYEYMEFISELKEYTDIDLVHKNGYQTKDKAQKDKKKDMAMVAGGFLFPPLHVYELGKKAMDAKDTLKDKDVIRKQMLLYGLVMMNKMCLEDFLGLK